MVMYLYFWFVAIAIAGVVLFKIARNKVHHVQEKIRIWRGLVFSGGYLIFFGMCGFFALLLSPYLLLPLTLPASLIIGCQEGVCIESFVALANIICINTLLAFACGVFSTTVVDAGSK